MGIHYNDVDLADYDCVTPGEAGLLSLPAAAYQTIVIPGREWASYAVTGYAQAKATLKAVVVGDDHADLLSNLGNVYATLRPQNPPVTFYSLTVPDISGKRLMAACLEGIQVSRDAIPWIVNYAEISVPLLLLYPWWEEVTPSTGTVSGSSGTLTNAGHYAADVVYTLTAGAILATGLWFDVGSTRFTYTEAIADNAVIVVDTALQTVTLGGVSAIANVDSSVGFQALRLAVGANTVTKSSPLFTLAASWRERTML